jgi:phospholipase/lecithinase/hemolysin
VYTEVKVLLVRSHLEEVVFEKFQAWNTALRNAAQQFGKNHPDATVLVFSSFEVFDTILDRPEEHGFDPKDVKRSGGSVWMDHIHPTSKVHDYIARHVAAFLESVQPAIVSMEKD